MNKTKRFLILTADMGFGHRSAANALAAALDSAYPGQCDVEVVNPLEGELVPPILRSTDAYDKIVTDLPNLYQLGYQASGAPVSGAVIESALTLALYETMRDLVLTYEPDVIISTYPYYQAPLGALFTIRRRSIPLMTVVTDLATVQPIWFNRASDYTLVPTDTVYRMAIDAGLTPEKVRLTGVPVHPNLVSETRSPQAIRAALGWRPDRITVLAVGGKRVRNLGPTLDVINHSGLPVQLALIAGGDAHLHHHLRDTEWHLPAYVYDYVDNLAEMMHAADLIVCKAGGLIVTEALACGLPLLLVSVLPGQEVGNAEYVVAGGAGELAKTSVDALKILCHWLLNDGDLLRRRAANARKLGRPNAAEEVARLAWAAAEAHPALPAQKHAGQPGLVALLERYGIVLDKRTRDPETEDF